MYKLKIMKRIPENKLKFIIEDRLSLQSTKRALEIYNLPKNTLNYLVSKDFVQNYFDKWDERRRKNFLTLVGGNEYWENLKNILEKTKN